MYSLCKGPVVGGNMEDTVPKRRYTMGRGIEKERLVHGGGWRCGPGPWGVTLRR